MLSKPCRTCKRKSDMRDEETSWIDDCPTRRRCRVMCRRWSPGRAVGAPDPHRRPSPASPHPRRVAPGIARAPIRATSAAGPEVKRPRAINPGPFAAEKVAAGYSRSVIISPAASVMLSRTPAPAVFARNQSCPAAPVRMSTAESLNTDDVVSSVAPLRPPAELPTR